jgi:hypothetical protein
MAKAARTCSCLTPLRCDGRGSVWKKCQRKRRRNGEFQVRRCSPMSGYVCHCAFFGFAVISSAKKIGTVLAHQHRKARESPQKAPGRRFHRHPIPHMEEGSRRISAAPDPVDGGPRTEHDSVPPVDTESGISTWVRFRFVFCRSGRGTPRSRRSVFFLNCVSGYLSFLVGSSWRLDPHVV